MENELNISGIGIAENVANSIVTMAAQKVARVASVGDRDLASGIRSGLVSLFTQQPSVSAEPVSCKVLENGKLSVDVHIAAFFGYQFTKLAEDLRSSIAAAVKAQMGVEAGEVNVFIDDLVFPKE